MTDIEKAIEVYGLSGLKPQDLPQDGTGVVKLDSWLEPFSDALRRRYTKAKEWIKTIDANEGGLETFSRVGL
ncbi:hypothetical protein E4U22_008178 [Claviceps purpurea]|nr:hypothetical protein E4U22_008178 [Claviceps purpurea]